jgi:hypothetical protein
MKKAGFLFLLFLLPGIFSSAQVILPYLINKDALPADSTKITVVQPIVGEQGYFRTTGLQIGDMAPDFCLYDTAGKACQLSQLLAKGKPVLLVAVSLTCPRSRRGMSDQLKTLTAAYGKDIAIRLIYVIDAHPVSPDPSVYSFNNVVDAHEINVHDNFCYKQPTTYSERKELAGLFIKRMNVTTPVLIDDPENSWWKVYGPAAHNAYLLTPHGMVYAKEIWFDNPKSKLSDNISKLLADETLMKVDPGKEAHIGKSQTSNNTVLFVNGEQEYSVNIVDVSGKSVFQQSGISAKEFDLEKLVLTKGAYSIIIKTAAARSYCLRYDRI